MSTSETLKLFRQGDLDIHYDAGTGQLRRVFDRALSMEVIAFEAGPEVEVNRLPLPMRLVDVDAAEVGPVWQCNLESVAHPSVGCAQGFDVFRSMVVGSECRPGGNHINPPQSLHIRYRLGRKQVNTYAMEVPHSAGKRPIQMPLWLDTIGTLAARTGWFGPETRLLQSAFGGCGPIEHVGHNEGLVREVTPLLWNTYRRTHPGVQAIPGAAYYHPDGRWLWITAQRPSVGMHWDFENDRQVAQFQYHARLEPAEIVYTPEVSLYWGRGGRAEMLARMNEAFLLFEEPRDWFYRTTWYWLHWWQYRARGYDDMVEHVKFLHGELGLTGFGLTSHDSRPGQWDCGTSSLGPSPHLGGDAGLRRLGETVRGLGGHMYVWLPFLGMGQPSVDLKDPWRIKGEDGRPYASFHHGSSDTYQAVNFNQPEVQAYYLDWIRRYVRDYRVDGIFWDCGGTPLPPDFSPRDAGHGQRFPSECMTGGYRFMERVMHEGRALSPDFFMWHEMFSTDLAGTGYSTNTGNDAFAMELNRHGRKRLVYRSCSTYNVYGRFPRVNPGSDCAFRSPVSVDTYRAMAGDPMNKWLVAFVREHGVRDAVGLQPGVALCANHLVVDPASQPVDVAVPAWAPPIRRLRNVLTGTAVLPERGVSGQPVFRLAGKAAYAIE